MDDDNSIETFDNLFEPFELKDDPDPSKTRTTGEQPIVTAQGTMIYCASCGSPNTTGNQHCESCGARLSRTQMPVAPSPMLRTTAGGRALLVLAGIILSVAVLALFFNLITGGGDGEAATSTTTATTLISVPITEVVPIRVDCDPTSEMPPLFPCSALIDDDPGNSWNAPEGGVGAEITFLFSPPVQITEMLITNVDDETRFLRNARIKGLEILIDDLLQTRIVELEDTNAEPQRIEVKSLNTSSVTLRVTSAYPGQSVPPDLGPFRELAAQEITFFGRVAPEQTP